MTKRKTLSEKKLDWGFEEEKSESSKAIQPPPTTLDKDASIIEGIDKKTADKLINNMVQIKKKKEKPETTRFTFDLDADLQNKLTRLAQHTNRSKASVLKFLIKQAYKGIED